MRLSFAFRLMCVLAAPAAIWSAGAARAQSLAIEPVTVQMAPGQMAETLTVVNQADSESSFQVRAFAWQVENGEDKLTPTDAVALSPPLGTIAPGGRQLIRLVLRAAPRDTEETYRIWLDQIPAATQPGAVRIALRLSIPIFAAPATRIVPDLHWRLRNDGGKFLLTATNSGSRHQVVRNLSAAVEGAPSAKVAGSPSPYVLAGASRSWQLVFAQAPSPGSRVHLTARTDDGDLDQIVALDPAAP